MWQDKIYQIGSFFRNLTLNVSESEQDIYDLLDNNDVGKVIARMNEHDTDVDNAVSEYNPQTHKVMKRQDKWVKGQKEPYRTEKLARTRQRYINHVELFFLLGNPIIWKKNDGDDEAFKLFRDYLEKKIYFNAKIRECKKLAGAETESAFVFNFSQKDGKMHADCYVAARSKGYKLRTLFDQFGNMTAAAVGYKLQMYGRGVECWDIFTPKYNFHCQHGAIGWSVNKSPNPTGKINLIYFRQAKAWEGVEPRIEREEMLDSKIGDTNNYFADPIAAATADVVSAMPKVDKPGKLIQLTGSSSRFEYINPPQNSEIRRAEKEDLSQSILFDTLTPDMSPEVMKSMSTLTSVGIKRALVLGYMKRADNIDIYGELIERFLHVCLAVLKELYPEMAVKIDTLDIGFEFAEPFMDDKKDLWTTIGQLYQQGIVSLEKAVQILALTDAPEEEVERIKTAQPQKNEPSEGKQE